VCGRICESYKNWMKFTHTTRELNLVFQDITNYVNWNNRLCHARWFLLCKLKVTHTWMSYIYISPRLVGIKVVFNFELYVNKYISCLYGTLKLNHVLHKNESMKFWQMHLFVNKHSTMNQPFVGKRSIETS
jgi:hypothetical protein